MTIGDGYVTDRITGKPVEGAKVQTYYTRYSNSGDSEKLNATYTTAKDGTIIRHGSVKLSSEDNSDDKFTDEWTIKFAKVTVS